MNLHVLPDDVRYASLDSAGLRRAFLFDDLFAEDRVTLRMVDVDRQVLGAAVPVREPLPLPVPAGLRAQTFCERRELGVINVGDRGRLRADGEVFEVPHTGCVYLGRGTRDVIFESRDPTNPAAFFLCSFPAHMSHPNRAATPSEARVIALGSQVEANQRRIHQYIHEEGIKSCQLVMGFTALAPGSVWNTLPPHTHARRCETYAYFDLPPAQQVMHIMGRPEETRHIFVANRQAVVSPSWSLHSGVGTHAYSFVWAMGGENQAFEDMDGVPLHALR